MTNRPFLTEQLPSLLNTLNADQKPNFGLMRAQHMVEHLIWTTKMFSRQAERPADWEPNKRVIGFQRFVANGCPFEHRPKEGQTEADLSPLRMPDIATAIAELSKTISIMYANADADASYRSFHPNLGEFSMQQLDLLVGQHCRWHAFQFGLVPDFQPTPIV